MNTAWTDIWLTSLPVFDAAYDFITRLWRKKVCVVFQNMYLEINKKTQQMSKLYGIITDTVKYKYDRAQQNLLS